MGLSALAHKKCEEHQAGLIGLMPQSLLYIYYCKPNTVSVSVCSTGFFIEGIESAYASFSFLVSQARLSNDPLL